MPAIGSNQGGIIVNDLLCVSIDIKAWQISYSPSLKEWGGIARSYYGLGCPDDPLWILFRKPLWAFFREGGKVSYRGKIFIKGATLSVEDEDLEDSPIIYTYKFKGIGKLKVVDR